MADDARVDDFDHMTHLQERVAAMGTRLRRFYAPGPLCSPNRCTYLTGQYPHNTGVNSNRIGVRGLDNTHTLATWLHAAGYTTSLVGKYVNGVRVTDPIPPGWDNWMVPGHILTYHYEHSEINDNGTIERLELHSNLAYSVRAQNFIRRHTHVPWFQWVSFVSPHDGQPHERVNAPPKTPDAVGRLPTRRPGGMGHGPFVREKYRNAFNGPTLPVGTEIGQFWEDEPLEEMRWLVQRRRDSLSDVDDQLGAMLDVLTETQQLDRTFVIVVSDNGYQYGEHGIRPSKDHPYEESVRDTLPSPGTRHPAGIHASRHGRDDGLGAHRSTHDRRNRQPTDHPPVRRHLVAGTHKRSRAGGRGPRPHSPPRGRGRVGSRLDLARARHQQPQVRGVHRRIATALRPRGGPP